MVKKDGKWGMMNISGKLILPYQFCGYSIINKNLIQLAVEYENGNYRYGFYDWKGKQIQPHKYYNKIEFTWSCFYEGLAWVSGENGIGFIDEKGNEIIPCIYHYPDCPWSERNDYIQRFRWVLYM